MESDPVPMQPPGSGFLRVRMTPVPGRVDEVDLVVRRDDPAGPPWVSQWSAGDGAPAVECVVEESRDGVCWVAASVWADSGDARPRRDPPCPM
jgi:hypothetical protein